IRIRQAKCKLPLMIFNVQNKNLHALWQYNLEPEVYSLDLLKQLIEHAPFEDSELSIHLKIESGMNRLGIIPDNIETLIRLLRNASNIKVKSVFSHLAASENEDHDSHTHEQVNTFLTGYEAICSALNYKPMKHILNTGGVVRFPEYQFDMVRLGLGLYGIDETSELRNKLIRSHTLKSHVLQVKRLKKGDTTGYNRAGKSEIETSIAVISIGYADGFMRKAGNGNWKVRIHDNYYPIIGNICMDVCMINIADHSNINPGDEVIIFDHENNVEKLAQVSETISYEIISRIAPRVKRIYVHK
ncbi:MAG: alanine racemase, partial [Saprospiraceae bacterium]|nr:alanine racemase [Saprospiraceae bacterium]